MSDPVTPSNPAAEPAAKPASATATPTTATPMTANPSSDDPSFGWNLYAERVNGRFAMVGFVALLVLEAVTHQDFWSWLGLR